MAEPAKVTEREAVPEDKLTGVLARFNGDAKEALASALDDIEFLQKELRYASLAMSYGFARGWQPSTERSVKRRSDANV